MTDAQKLRGKMARLMLDAVLDDLRPMTTDLERSSATIDAAIVLVASTIASEEHPAVRAALLERMRSNVANVGPFVDQVLRDAGREPH